MHISEVIIPLLIYSGLFIFFLGPSTTKGRIKTSEENSNFSIVFKNHLVKMIFRKKTIFAVALFGFALFITQSMFASAQWHYNAHSGLPPIRYTSPTVLAISGLVIYTSILFLLVGYVGAKKESNMEKQ